MNDKNNLYSIRMRATLQERHLSGAERIVPEDRIDATMSDLVARARNREIGPDRITVSVDPLDPACLRYLTSLDVATLDIHDHLSSREHAVRILTLAGVSKVAALSAMAQIGRGASPSGTNMRGAMIMDAATGDRLEPDQERGIRSSRFDWTDEALQRAMQRLERVGLTHHRTREALALATKVAYAPGMVAELCWSDDSDYTTGYVASLSIGYVRLPYLKERGDTHGGRAFFVDRDTLDLIKLIQYLEVEALLVNGCGICYPVINPMIFYDKQVSCHV